MDARLGTRVDSTFVSAPAAMLYRPVDDGRLRWINVERPQYFTVIH